jgi:hypothetical protein
MIPHKFNASRRHKFEKKRQKITNWRVYNEGLRQLDDTNANSNAATDEPKLKRSNYTPFQFSKENLLGSF